MVRPVAALFTCCVLGACGGGGPTNFSNNPPPPPAASNLSLQFFGSGGGIDRVKIPLVDAGGTPRAVNIGATDFTIEFWVKGALVDNPTTGCTAGALAKDAWLDGAVLLDRDVAGDGDFGEYGVALLGGQVAFGVGHAAAGQTLCGARNVLDGAWHHVALTRRLTTGDMTIFVDGALDRSALNTGASGDVSYNPAHVATDPNDAFLVIGAQKRDAASARPFKGFIDELRFTNRLRYPPIALPTAPFGDDGNTVALYHFDEANGLDILDAAAAGPSPGVLLPVAAGTNRSTDVPF